jgi:hypothetical protein
VAVFDWLAAERKQDPSPTLWRVAVSWPRRWRHTLWGTGLRTGVPVVDFGWVSGNFLAYRAREFTAAGLRDWSVRYVLTEDPATPLPGATQVFQRGGIWVWQMPSYDGLSVLAPPGVQIQGLRYEPDRIRFVVSGAGAGGAPVHIRTAWFPAWRAWQNGNAIPVRAEPPRPDAKPRQEQLAVTASNGEVVLTCDGPMPGSGFGALVSLLALAAIALAGTGRGRDRMEAVVREALSRARAARQHAVGWLARLPRRRRMMVWLVPVVVLALFAVGVRLRGATRLRPSPWELSGLSATATRGLVTERCKPSYMLGRARCGDLAELDFYLGADPKRDDTAEYLTLFPALRLICREPGTEITARWRNIRLAGRTLEVRYHTAGSVHGSITAGKTVIFQGPWTGSGTQRIPLPANAPRTGPVVFRVNGGGGALLAIDARTVDGSTPGKVTPR